MADLTALPHRLDAEARTCRVVIETPKASRVKYDFNRGLQAFELNALLPEGLSFPLDFGFVPSTKAEDGDPLDVLVLFDAPVAVGAVLDVRLIGVIEANQTQEGKTNRNDRLMAVALQSRLHAHIHNAAELDDAYLANLTGFWVQYNALRNKHFEVRRLAGPEAAVAAVHRTDQGG
jgi:inorganic pyrophosphatase